MGGDWSIVSSKTRAKMNKTVGKTNSGELWWSKEENRLFSVRQVSALVNKTSTDLLHAFLFDEICTVYCGQLKTLFSRRLRKGNRPNFVFVPSLYSLWVFIVMELWMCFCFLSRVGAMLMFSFYMYACLQRFRAVWLMTFFISFHFFFISLTL